MRRLWAALAGVLSALLWGCLPSPEPVTVPGPERDDLAAQLDGVILMDRPVGGMTAIRAADGVQSEVRPQSRTKGTVHSIGGPDREGRIAFVANHMTEERHELRVVGGRGSGERVLFSRPGDALWPQYHAMGAYLALAPTGGLVAFISHTRDAQMYHPQVLLTEGRLELWNTVRPFGQLRGTWALDARMSWFPDGVRLAYAALVPHPEAGALPLEDDSFGAQWARWPRVPFTYVLNTSTGRSDPIHVGTDPIVSSDGAAILVSDGDGRHRLVDMASRKSDPATLPGFWGEAFALVKGTFALYVAYPTEGLGGGYTESNSPLVGPKQMLSIKVADVETGRFQTVVRSVDPRRCLSYGAARSLP